MAALIGATQDGTVVTGSGSEANNVAIRGTVLAATTDRSHLIIQPTEHPALPASCAVAGSAAATGSTVQALSCCRQSFGLMSAIHPWRRQDR